ncbi:hypothetical protein E2C01_064309 [Portunus trituberculatus]|uniref:Uncharacterized protein n=1 Tax=Portunus trituberculatus TaxID=210409 RepID=A0A5B7HFV8_PORTR|nr:hypothetical protein [Portunus trituberculatus]
MGCVRPRSRCGCQSLVHKCGGGPADHTYLAALPGPSYLLRVCAPPCVSCQRPGVTAAAPPRPCAGDEWQRASRLDRLPLRREREVTCYPASIRVG